MNDSQSQPHPHPHSSPISNTIDTFFKVPWLITGPAGCGKSHFIRTAAEKEGKQLLHWSCRRDRTLRDGRQILHTWAKRSENAIIWLEGVDDLTQESQAFLRRISETHSPLVCFVLECRDGSKLQDPIRSRYSLWNIQRPSWEVLKEIYPDIIKYSLPKYIPADELSHRRVQSILNLIEYHWDDWIRYKNTIEIENNVPNSSIMELQKEAVNPLSLIKTIVEDKDIHNYAMFLFNNGNPWAFLAYMRSTE
jgi:DNA polymerase III delta prime subunit